MPPKSSLYIGNLPQTITLPILRSAFLPFGEITNVELPRDMKSGLLKGFAFLSYLSPEDCQEALFNMSGSELLSKILIVRLSDDNKLKLGDRKSLWDEGSGFEEKEVENLESVVEKVAMD